jgi:hypothetical protein
MSPLTIDGSGRLTLPAAALREIGSRPLELSSHSPRHLLFTAGGEEEAVVFAGRLGEVGVADLISFLNMFRKSGILHFAFAGGSKELYFQNGEVVFAVSTFPEEDLGEILFALGKVDREILQKARQSVAGHTTIGKILVDKGMVASKDLWQATRHQVETIVYHLFTFHQGNFSFLAKSLEQEEILRLSLSTQNLIMEGLRRVDESALYMRRIRSLDALVLPADPAAEGKTPAEQRLLALVRAGVRDGRELLSKSGLGEFDALRLLYQLLERGAVRLEAAPVVAVSGAIGEILAIFNGALTALYRRIVVTNPGFPQEARLFLRDLPQPFSFVFREVTLQADGTVDGGRLVANLAGLEEEDKKRLLVDALNELLFMECLVARRELGAADSTELVQRVQEISRRVKNFIGRNECKTRPEEG